jgi:outer membrane murein-binding lipoprotein Lpp
MDSSALSNAEFWLSVIATGKLVAAFLVAAGVAIEFGGDWIARPFERTVKESREAQLSSLNSETARLSAESETARASIAAANERAATAEQRAAEANLELARMKAPRTLNAEQQERIASKLKPFGAIPFDFSVQTDTEPIDLMEQVAATLEAAGWVRRPIEGVDITTGPRGKPQAGVVAASGLLIEISESRMADWQWAVVALRDALIAEGLAATATGIADKSALPNAIHIKIGKKP